MAMELALLMRPGAAPPVRHAAAKRAFTALTIGEGLGLDGLVQELLREAGLDEARRVAVPTLEAALGHLAQERPGVLFLGVAAPDFDSLNSLVRLQAAAPGAAVIPLPMPLASSDGGPWRPWRLHHGFDREEVVSLLQQLALLDEGARQLFFLATHDRLTGLANRWLLEERLRHAILRSRRSGLTGALLFFDLDGFKAINDRLGHEAGDRMLVLVARRLKEGVRASDTVARWGGDEFAVIIEGVQEREPAHEAGARLLQRLAEPHDEPGIGPLRASVGTALFPDDGQDVSTLLARADQRMYRAKGRGLLRAIFRRG